jgi:antitoxin VapB
MNIRSTKVDRLIEQLSRLTGEDVETAVARAIEERLSRVAQPEPVDRKAAMTAFFEHASRMPILDPRSSDDIIGYNSLGLPS